MHRRTADRSISSYTPAESADVAPLELAHEIACCHRLMRACLIDRLRGWGISDHDFWILWLCDRAAPDGVVQHELAAAAGVSEAQMSGLVERMRQNGLLIGCRSELDRRRQYWQLTAAGSELLGRIRSGLGDWPTDQATAFSGQDQGTLLELIQKLTHDLAGDGARGGKCRPAAVPSWSREADDEASHRRAS